MIKNSLGKINVFPDPRTPDEQRQVRRQQDSRDSRDGRLFALTVSLILAISLVSWWKLVYQPTAFCFDAASRSRTDLLNIQQGTGVDASWANTIASKEHWMKACMQSQHLSAVDPQRRFVTLNQFGLATAIETVVIFLFLLAFGDRYDKPAFKLFQSIALASLLTSLYSIGLAFGLAATLITGIAGLLGTAAITRFKYTKVVFFFLGISLSIYALTFITLGGLN
ncbi:hypothetical protein EPO05_01080 [Patescibacteria group bacterium]|nr:MAG: hypothetical protein EPO05_01080 [Patescibacteria group bacterium]